MPRPDERANRRAQPEGVRWRRGCPRQRYMHGGHVRRHPCGNSAVRECQIRPSPCSRGRQTRRCKGYGGDAARCGQYAGGGLAARPGTPGEPVLADGRSYPRRRQTRRCKGYGGDAARYGQYAGGGLAASVGTPGEPVLADGNEVIPGNGGDALRFARIIPRPFRAIAHNGVRISPRLAAVIPYFPAAFNRPCCNPNFA